MSFAAQRTKLLGASQSGVRANAAKLGLLGAGASWLEELLSVLGGRATPQDEPLRDKIEDVLFAMLMARRSRCAKLELQWGGAGIPVGVAVPGLWAHCCKHSCSKGKTFSMRPISEIACWMSVMSMPMACSLAFRAGNRLRRLGGVDVETSLPCAESGVMWPCNSSSLLKHSKGPCFGLPTLRHGRPGSGSGMGRRSTSRTRLRREPFRLPERDLLGGQFKDNAGS